jgi:lactate permease
MVGRTFLSPPSSPFWLFAQWSAGRKLQLPAILVVGISFSITQFLWSNHVDSNLVDIASAVVSILATIAFLLVWKPRKIWRFDYDKPEDAAVPTAPTANVADDMGGTWPAKEYDGYVAPTKYPAGVVLKAWMPFAILSVFVLLWGLPKIKLAMNQATAPFKVVLADGQIARRPDGTWPYLHGLISRNVPVVAKPTPEAALRFNWLPPRHRQLLAAPFGLLLGMSPKR